MSGPVITRVELQRVEDVPLARPVHLGWDPGTVRTHDSFTVVRVTTADGWTGVGTVARTAPARAVANDLIGNGLYDPHELGNAYGIDIALRDLAGKHRGTSLAALWGATTDRVRGYASLIDVGSPGQRAEDAIGFAEEGFRGLKLRLHHATLAEDVALATAVRDAVGDRLVLMADANQARAAQRGTAVRWDLPRATATARALADLGFLWLEEPLPADALADLARLRATAGLAIAGGERDRGLPRLMEVIDSGAYDVLQPDAVTGAALGCLPAVAARAGAAGLACIPHHGGGGIGGYAHLHLAAAIPNAGWVEILRDRPGETPWPTQRVPTVPLAIDADGDVPVPTGPGLGITLDEDLLAAHTVAVTTHR
jgi:D-galactarolactone cycloisomerase